MKFFKPRNDRVVPPAWSRCGRPIDRPQLSCMRAYQKPHHCSREVGLYFCSSPLYVAVRNTSMKQRAGAIANAVAGNCTHVPLAVTPLGAARDKMHIICGRARRCWITGNHSGGRIGIDDRGESRGSALVNVGARVEHWLWVNRAKFTLILEFRAASLSAERSNWMCDKGLRRKRVKIDGRWQWEISR